MIGTSASRYPPMRVKWSQRCSLAAFWRSSPVAAVSVKFYGHVLDVGVLLDGVHGHVLAVARLLVAAVRHLGGDRQQVVVDPDRAELEPARGVQRPRNVTREDRGGEAVADVVRHRDRV